MFYVQDMTMSSYGVAFTQLTLYGNESSYASSPTTITARQSNGAHHFYNAYNYVGTLTLKHLKFC